MSMKTTFAIFIAAALLISPVTATDLPYDEYEADLALLRDNFEIDSGGGKIKASSALAINAARRIFSNVSFLFKTRDEILLILGDPSTISDYGVQLAPEMDTTIIYRFDTGFGGSEYHIKLHQNQVVGVEHKGIN